MKQDLHKTRIEIDSDTYMKLPSFDEAESLFQVVNENREHLRTFLFWVDYNKTIEQSLEFIRDANNKAENGAALHLCIYYQGKIAGTCGFHYFDYSNFQTEIGYWLAPSYEGRGIMTKCCKAVIDFAFHTLGMHRIELRSSTQNERSQKLARRLGFHFEGVQREACKLPSGFHDMQLFSKLSID